ncbi:MAG: hypothetical protein CR217_15880 [Beijerinckiaceae bacterium]|nr:MAG: hypothetical protein CR217_15880 [Beijerinckiaceae bacterium]
MERLDPALNAIVQKDAASARRAAASSDPRELNPNPRAIEVNGKQRPYFNPMLGPASPLVPLCRPPSPRRCLERRLAARRPKHRRGLRGPHGHCL